MVSEMINSILAAEKSAENRVEATKSKAKRMIDEAIIKANLKIENEKERLVKEEKIRLSECEHECEEIIKNIKLKAENDNNLLEKSVINKKSECTELIKSILLFSKKKTED